MLWVNERSVSVLEIHKVTGDTFVGSESQVKLGRTFHPVKIAALGMLHTCMCTNGLVGGHSSCSKNIVVVSSPLQELKGKWRH